VEENCVKRLLLKKLRIIKYNYKIQEIQKSSAETVIIFLWIGIHANAVYLQFLDGFLDFRYERDPRL